MNENLLLKLHQSISKDFNIGSYEDFKLKMLNSESRSNLYQKLLVSPLNEILEEMQIDTFEKFQNIFEENISVNSTNSTTASFKFETKISSAGLSLKKGLNLILINFLITLAVGIIQIINFGENKRSINLISIAAIIFVSINTIRFIILLYETANKLISVTEPPTN